MFDFINSNEFDTQQLVLSLDDNWIARDFIQLLEDVELLYTILALSTESEGYLDEIITSAISNVGDNPIATPELLNNILTSQKRLKIQQIEINSPGIVSFEGIGVVIEVLWEILKYIPTGKFIIDIFKNVEEILKYLDKEYEPPWKLQQKMDRLAYEDAVLDYISKVRDEIDIMKDRLKDLEAQKRQALYGRRMPRKPAKINDIPENLEPLPSPSLNRFAKHPDEPKKEDTKLRLADLLSRSENMEKAYELIDNLNLSAEEFEALMYIDRATKRLEHRVLQLDTRVEEALVRLSNSIEGNKIVSVSTKREDKDAK
jgi:hypothetical protein